MTLKMMPGQVFLTKTLYQGFLMMNYLFENSPQERTKQAKVKIFNLELKHSCLDTLYLVKQILYRCIIYLNNYFDFHVCLSFRPPSVRPSVRLSEN